MPTIADIEINGHTYTDSMWRSDPEGTLSGIANDIATIVGALDNSLGILTKAISGNTTLSGTESTNIGFVFTGSLGADATITFAAGFNGIAQIENQTTGGFSLICGLASGDQVTVPPLGSTAAFCDGVDFSLRSGVVRTSSGAKVVGNFEATGTFDVDGNATIGGALSVAGAMSLDTTLDVTGIATFQDVEVQGAISGLTNISGGLTISEGTTSLLDTNISGPSVLDGSVTINGAVTIDDDVTINDNVLVGVSNVGFELAGKVAAKFIRLESLTYAQMSAQISGLAGTLAVTNNSSVTTPGGTPDGNGSNVVLCFGDGTVWKIVA